MQQRERQRPREERLPRQVQHHRAILADRIEHHRPRGFGDRLAQDEDALRLEPVEMGQGDCVIGRLRLCPHRCRACHLRARRMLGLALSHGENAHEASASGDSACALHRLRAAAAALRPAPRSGRSPADPQPISALSSSQQLDARFARIDANHDGTAQQGRNPGPASRDCSSARRSINSKLVGRVQAARHQQGRPIQPRRNSRRGADGQSRTGTPDQLLAAARHQP